MTLALLCLLVLAGALVGAAVTLLLVSPPVTDERAQIYRLARQGRRR